jgi:hypothetical protein
MERDAIRHGSVSGPRDLRSAFSTADLRNRQSTGRYVTTILIGKIKGFLVALIVWRLTPPSPLKTAAWWCKRDLKGPYRLGDSTNNFGVDISTLLLI